MDRFLAKCATSDLLGQAIEFSEPDQSEFLLKEGRSRSKGQTHVDLASVLRDTRINAAILLYY